MKIMARTPKPKKALGRRLLAIRTELGLTQEQAAEKVCVSRETWQSWETGRRKPNRSALKLIDMLQDGKL